MLGKRVMSAAFSSLVMVHLPNMANGHFQVEGTNESEEKMDTNMKVILERSTKQNSVDYIF